MDVPIPARVRRLVGSQNCCRAALTVSVISSRIPPGDVSPLLGQAVVLLVEAGDVPLGTQGFPKQRKPPFGEDEQQPGIGLPQQDLIVEIGGET